MVNKFIDLLSETNFFYKTNDNTNKSLFNSEFRNMKLKMY